VALLVSAVLVYSEGPAGAQAPGSQPTPPAPAAFEPPRALTPTTVPYPAGAPSHHKPRVVKVKMLVGANGRVQKVVPLTSPQPVFDAAVKRAVSAFRFQPARHAGRPVPVEITFTHTFLPQRPTAVAPSPRRGPPLTSVLRGRLVEMGTRAPVSGATVAALVAGRRYTVEADNREGRFSLRLPAGAARVTVHAAGYLAFLQRETLRPRQRTTVTYYLQRERYDPYEIVVVDQRRRQEVSRISLRGAEIKQIPGTFGDPFRVVQTLPGTASVISLLPFPVVRGASPSSTGFLLDGTRVPLLYHLLVGSSVIHPELIDEVNFYPGGAPVNYGGYTSGIVDGRTHRARADEKLIDLDANLLSIGGLVRWPVKPLGVTVTAAARYGYPGLILSLATDQASLSYWDYQLRVDGGNPVNGWTLFVYGAGDQLDTISPEADPNDPDPPLEPALVLQFHRADLRFFGGSGRLRSVLRLVAGFDRTESAGTNVRTGVLEPSARLSWRHGERLTVNLGAEGIYHDLAHASPPENTSGDFSLASVTQDLGLLLVGSTYLEVLWRPTPGWLIRPGVRGDLLYDGETTTGAVDPRLTVRYRLLSPSWSELPEGSDEGSIWLKGAVGVFHQPPRFVLPLPGLDTMPLKYGLLRSIQASVGVEAPLPLGATVSVEGYFNYMDPTIFDLTVNAQDLNTAANTSLFPQNTAPSPGAVEDLLDRLLSPTVGRAYGLEVLLRRRARNGVYGWISYTLSLSERQRDGVWAPYDFDRSHLLNLVLGLPLPRNWDLGLRFQYHSGKAATTTYGYNTARTDGYVRVDLRLDKRAVWKGWLLDFYVDLINAAVLPEELTPGTVIRYVLPTIGLRGRI